MNRIIITYNHAPVGESVAEFVRSKFTTLFDRCDSIARILVELNLESEKAAERNYIARAILEIAGRSIVVVAESKNAYATLGELLRKAEQQLRAPTRKTRFKQDRGLPFEEFGPMSSLSGSRSSTWTLL